MALRLANLVRADIEGIYTCLTNDKTLTGMRAGVQALNELVGKLNPLYPVIEIVITSDADDEGVSEFIAAEASMSIGVVLLKKGTASFDLNDNSFNTAKGSALADGDIFVLDGADSVEYLGNGSGKAFDFAGETNADFVNL